MNINLIGDHVSPTIRYIMFEILYSTDAKGKTRYWKISVEGATITREYGMVGGKPIINSKQVVTHRSQSTLEDQAIFEAKSYYQSQLKKGYSPSADADAEASTDASDVTVLPMLAQKYNPLLPNIRFPCLGQPKLDGIRHLARRPQDGDVVIQTRRGTTKQFFDETIRAQLRSIQIPDNLILDGEFYSIHPEIPFKVLNGYCNRTTLSGWNSIPEDHKRAISYYIFDCYIIDYPQTPFEERWAYLRDFFDQNELPNIKLVETTEVLSKDHALSLHNQWVESGYEGLMLRSPGGMYRSNVRSSDLLKYKSFLDSEFIIKGAESPDSGGEHGCIIWILGLPDDPNATFTCRPRGTHDERRHEWTAYQSNPELYLGRLYTVRYQETYDNGIPRFPVGISIRYDL